MFCSGILHRRPALGALAFASLLSLSSTAVQAHDAPSGWSYPTSCCSGIDCREVRDDQIIEGPNGYVIKVTGEVIPMTSRKVRQSPDGVYHWCSVGGSDQGRTICLFVPPRMF